MGGPWSRPATALRCRATPYYFNSFSEVPHRWRMVVFSFLPVDVPTGNSIGVFKVVV